MDIPTSGKYLLCLQIKDFSNIVSLIITFEKKFYNIFLILRNFRYDPIGVGRSTINDLTVQVEDWLDSALAMVDNICDKDVPIIIVSSSVGSWVGNIT